MVKLFKHSEAHTTDKKHIVQYIHTRQAGQPPMTTTDGAVWYT